MMRTFHMQSRSTEAPWIPPGNSMVVVHDDDTPVQAATRFRVSSYYHVEWWGRALLPSVQWIIREVPNAL